MTCYLLCPCPVNRSQYLSTIPTTTLKSLEVQVLVIVRIGRIGNHLHDLSHSLKLAIDVIHLDFERHYTYLCSTFSLLFMDVLIIYYFVYFLIIADDLF
jgi:hypothetical protein